MRRTLANLDGGMVAVALQRGAQPLLVQAEPGAYTFPPFTSRILAGGVGYLRLNEFESSQSFQDNGLQFATDLDRRLDDFDAHGVTGIVLDLRGNGGGDAETAVQLLGRFLPPGTPAVRNFDAAGHETIGVVASAMRAKQLPLAVLVDGGSASASEQVAAVLKQAHRAVLVGDQTMGALAAARLYDISDIAALEIAVAGVKTMDGTVIDGAGVPVDVQAGDTRTAGDYRSGNAPQLSTALQALAQAPAPPAYVAPPLQPPTQQVHTLLAGYVPVLSALALPDGSSIPLQPGGSETVTDPGEIAAEDAPDPAALAQALHDRGWLGRQAASFDTVVGGAREEIEVSLDAYATPAGAAAALRANDLPGERQPAQPAVQLGDGTTAYSGAWMENGWSEIAWQRGDVLATVTYAGDPGAAHPEIAAAFAQQLDGSLGRFPPSGVAFQRQVAELASAAGAPQRAAVELAPAAASQLVQPAASAGRALQSAGDSAHAGRGLPNPLSPTLIILLGFAAAFLVAVRYAVRRR